MLTIIGDLAEAIGLIIASIAVIRSIKENRDSQDLNIFINLSENFRSKWEEKWEATLLKIDQGEECTTHSTELKHMLNWIDWLGSLILSKKLKDHSIFFNSIGTTITRIINTSRPILEAEIREHGINYWKGVLIIGKKLKIKWIEDLV